MQQDLSKARAHCYFQKVLDILFEMGEFLFREENYDEALKKFEEIVTLCTDRELDTQSQRETYLDGLRRSIDCLIELDYVTDASVKAEKYLSLSKDFKLLPHLQQAYLNQARAFMYLADGENLTSSEKKNYLTNAEKMFLGSEKTLNDIKKASKDCSSDLEVPRKKASLFQNMAQFFCNTDQLETAFHYLNLGIELARQSRDLQDILLLLYCDAQALYEKRKEYDLCLEYAKKYLNIIEKNKDSLEEKFNCYYHIARYHCMNSNTDDAYTHIKLAKKMKNATKFELSENALKLGRRLKLCKLLRSKLDDDLELSGNIDTIEQLGDTYCQVQSYKLSNECYEAVLRLLDKQGNTFGQKVYDLKLSICLNLCDSNLFSHAVEIYLELLKLLRKNGVEIEEKDEKMSRIARHISKCYHNLSDKSNAELYMDKAHKYAESETSLAKCNALASRLREQEHGYLSADSDYADDSDDALLEEIGSSSSDSETEKKRKVPLNKQRRNAKGETKLQVAVIEGKYSVVRSLINQGYSVNVRDNNGWTPLHEAANHGHVEICKLLVENGAKVDSVMAQTGLTPLMDAMQSHQFECAKVLLENGAYPYFPGKIGICAADTFYELLDKQYGEDNTTAEEWKIIEEIKSMLSKIPRPKCVAEAKANTKVLDAHLLSNREAQCPEIVSGGSSDEDDDAVYDPPSELLRTEQTDSVTVTNEPGTAMDMYEDALRCQSRRNALYRSRTADDIKRSDRIKERRREKDVTVSGNETKTNDTLKDTNEASWLQEVRSFSSRKSGSIADSGICSTTESSVSLKSKKSESGCLNEPTKIKEKITKDKRLSKRVVIDDSSSSDSEKENIPTNPCKRRSQEVTPEKRQRPVSPKKSEEICDRSSVIDHSRTLVVDKPNIIELQKVSSPEKDESSQSNNDLSENESLTLSPEIGNKSAATSTKLEVAKPCIDITTYVSDVLSIQQSSKVADLNQKDADDILSLELDNHPLCSTFISNSSESVKCISNRPLFQGIAPILPYKAIDVNIRYITNRTMETIFTANVNVKDGNETVLQILERSNFKQKFDLVPLLDVKFRGVRYRYSNFD